MELQQSFEQAVIESKQLSRKPDNATLLRLYSLYKQATEGDAPAESGAGAFDFVAKAKHEAWDELRGKSREEAMQEYVALVEELKQQG
jgi:acyl-CoA-binding protein